MSFETIHRDDWKPAAPVDTDDDPTWTPSIAFKMGDKVWAPNPPTLLDRIVMALGFRRRSPEYRTFKCVGEYITKED